MPQSSSILYFSSITKRQQFAPSSCKDRIFFTNNFIQNQYKHNNTHHKDNNRMVDRIDYQRQWLLIVAVNIIEKKVDLIDSICYLLLEFRFRIIFHMLIQIIFIALVSLAQSSIVIPPQGLGQNPPQDIYLNSNNVILPIPSIQATQQNLLNNYIPNSQVSIFNRGSSERQIILPPAQNIDEKSAQLIRQQHSQLINGYFMNKNTANIDNGVNNTVEGIRNVIEFGNMNKINGNENILNGSKNSINGSGNQVKGNDNSINSKNNVVYGNGNQISDMPFTPKAKTQIQTTPSQSQTTNNKNTQQTSTIQTVNNSNNLSNQFQEYTTWGVILLLLLILLQ